MESSFKLYSLGIVIEDKPQGVDYILVSPIEDLNIQKEGLIKDFKKDLKGEKKDLESVNFKTEHEAKSYVRAKWIPYGESNRNSAPDVYASETVILFKFGNVDEYYWTDVLREPELRRLEDVLYSYSNLKVKGNPFNENSSYWVRFNTRDKYIQLRTSDNDGEAVKYDIKIDTKKGVITILDNLGNSLELDSTKGNLTATTTNDINLKAANNINLTAGNDVVIATGGNLVQNLGKGMSMNSSSGAVLSGPSITHDTPIVRNTGNVETAGYDLAHPNKNAEH